MAISNSIRLRAGLIVILVLIQVGMFLHYGFITAGCPNYECFAEDYDRYVGQRFLVGGPVVATSPPTIALIYGGGKSFELRLQGFSARVSPGDRVVVYGTFKPDRTMHVQNFIVHQASNLYYMYSVSILAIALVVVIGLREWRFDVTEFVFRPRGGR